MPGVDPADVDLGLLWSLTDYIARFNWITPTLELIESVLDFCLTWSIPVVFAVAVPTAWQLGYSGNDIMNQLQVQGIDAWGLVTRQNQFLFTVSGQDAAAAYAWLWSEGLLL